nr:MAG TPA: hypothetical protein [Inoviridae sp.]
MFPTPKIIGNMLPKVNRKFITYGIIYLLHKTRRYNLCNITRE